MSKSSPQRYIPSIDTIVRASQELPLADQWRSDTYHVSLNDDRLLEFKRVKMKGKLGRTTATWVYDGKVRVK
jgi:hypothetical protein